MNPLEKSNKNKCTNSTDDIKELQEDLDKFEEEKKHENEDEATSCSDNDDEDEQFSSSSSK